MTPVEWPHLVQPNDHFSQFLTLRLMLLVLHLAFPPYEHMRHLQPPQLSHIQRWGQSSPRIDRLHLQDRLDVHLMLIGVSTPAFIVKYDC